MMYKKLEDFIFNCKSCPTRCDGVSKEEYYFEKDSAFSENYEQQIIQYINQNTPYSALKTEMKGYPDIEVYKKDDRNPILYLEIKVQRRTFMSVEKILPKSNLKPSETLALNLSDLIRYFQVQEETGTPVFIMWGVLNRPCIVSKGKTHFFYQHCDVLKSIYEEVKQGRRFRRSSGAGDIVNGEHKGVVVNYHFSLKELKKWNPEKNLSL